MAGQWNPQRFASGVPFANVAAGKYASGAAGQSFGGHRDHQGAQGGAWSGGFDGGGWQTWWSARSRRRAAARKRKVAAPAFRPWVSCQRCYRSWVYCDAGVAECRKCGDPFPQQCWPSLGVEGTDASQGLADVLKITGELPEQTKQQLADAIAKNAPTAAAPPVAKPSVRLVSATSKTAQLTKVRDSAQKAIDKIHHRAEQLLKQIKECVSQLPEATDKLAQANDALRVAAAEVTAVCAEVAGHEVPQRDVEMLSLDELQAKIAGQNRR